MIVHPNQKGDQVKCIRRIGLIDSIFELRSGPTCLGNDLHLRKSVAATGIDTVAKLCREITGTTNRFAFGVTIAQRQNFEHTGIGRRVHLFLRGTANKYKQ
ncbi:hypothetical protein NUACC21_00370 [Scytonema sp. NUACC21]